MQSLVVWGGIGIVVWTMGLPLLILFTFRAQAQPTLEVVTDDGDLPQDVGTFLEAIGQELSELGFETVETMFLPQMVNNVTTIVRLYLHPNNEDMAMAVTAYARQENRWKVQSQYVEFSSRSDDGREFSTRNNKVVGAFPIPDHVTTVIYHRAASMEQLYQAHLAVMRVRGVISKTLRLYDEFAGIAPEYVARGVIEELERAREQGYLRYADVNPSEASSPASNPYQVATATAQPAYVATLKGAYLMAWNELWPLKPLNLLRHLSRSKHILREAGVYR